MKKKPKRSASLKPIDDYKPLKKEDIMKTLKLVLIAAILAFGMTSLPAHSEANSIRVINLSLEKALQEPGLVAAMYQQLTLASLTLDQNGTYSAIVTYNLVVYRIYGPYKVWVRFFNSRPPVPYSANGMHQ